MDDFIKTSIWSTVITLMFVALMVYSHEMTHTVQSQEFGCNVTGYSIDFKGAYTYVDWGSCDSGMESYARLANANTEAVGYLIIPISAILIFMLCNWWLYYMLKN